MSQYNIYHCSWCGQHQHTGHDGTSETENPFTKDTTVISLMELLGLSASILVRGAFFQLCNTCTELVSYGRSQGDHLRLVDTVVTKTLILRQQDQVKTILKNRTRRWIAEDMRELREDGTLLLGQLLSRCFFDCVVTVHSEALMTHKDQGNHRTDVEKIVQETISEKPVERVGSEQMGSKEVQADLLVDPEPVDRANSCPIVEANLQGEIVVPEPEERSRKESCENLGAANGSIVNNVLNDQTQTHTAEKISFVGHSEKETFAEKAFQDDTDGNDVCAVSDTRIFEGTKKELCEERLERRLRKPSQDLVSPLNVNNNSIYTDNQNQITQLRPAPCEDWNVQMDDIVSGANGEFQQPERTTYDYVTNYRISNLNALPLYASMEIDIYECSGCAEVLQSVKDKVEHENTHKMFREPDGSIRYKCGICQVELYGYQNLKLHRLTHVTRQFVCDVCDKICVTQKSLVQHLETHNLEIPFKCVFCNKKFSRNEDLILHQQMHTGPDFPAALENFSVEVESPDAYNQPREMETGNFIDALPMPDTYVKTSSQPEPMNQATALMEVDQTPRERILSVRCGGCWKKFQSVLALGIHEKTHLIYRGGSFWYKCKLCSARYSSYLDLRSHRISHPTHIVLKRVKRVRNIKE